MTAQFVLVTASREDSWISAVVAEDEWAKLFALAEALPKTMTWTAVRVEGQGHRSSSA